MATALIPVTTCQIKLLLRIGVRAKFRNGHLFCIDFLNATQAYKAKENITM